MNDNKNIIRIGGVPAAFGHAGDDDGDGGDRDEGTTWASP